MKHEKIANALNAVSDTHIADAARLRKKRRTYRWVGAIAAALVLVLLLQGINIPAIIRAEAISTAADPRIMKRPSYDSDSFDKWIDERNSRSAATQAALSQMDRFLKDGCAQFLTGSEENTVYSPINVYMGLSMLAECTAGNSRQQILDLLGTQDTDALREQVSALWEIVYNKEQNQIVTLANSLWLDNGLTVNQATADDLAYHYYASVYRQDLVSGAASKAIGAWLNNNTGGMLKGAADAYQLPAETILALYSTIYFQGRWSTEFNPSNNTESTFHAPDGDITRTFMNARLREMSYCWGEDFGAVHLGLKNGSSMWFFLPDEDKTVDDVLSSGEYMDFIQNDESVREKNKYMKVNLSIPKFDIATTSELKEGLMALGITDVFDLFAADFSAITDMPAALSAANQSVRVMIDEEGVKAAAYFELPGAGAAEPPEEIIDFILDRPFLFVITSNRVPLFAGVVNQP